ncbi:hypothetical protein EVJ58_g1744 [Rhodofomes roseus]|uniref:Protein-S-isoprenylcysteine O-methyltransferase n=1 Tax=Rhodofomes roseus TaxID=34475 RepID=A0A4Y9YXZ9_9APHY|nr:hypothetical protein EVJ58_g1744 [Rhodofomes roseus]
MRLEQGLCGALSAATVMDGYVLPLTELLTYDTECMHAARSHVSQAACRLLHKPIHYLPSPSGNVMSLVKLPFLVSGLITTYTVQTPPHARVASNQRAKDVGLHERFLSTTARLNVEIIKVLRFPAMFSRSIYCTPLIYIRHKALTSIPLLIEAAVIVANRFPSTPLSRWILRIFTRGNPGVVQRLVLSPAFLAACVVEAAGGVFRYQCYRTLGRFFTLELAIHDGHKLITEGPYRYVRHPSYTAWSTGAVGVGLMSLTRGAWFREAGLLETGMGRLACAFGVMYVVYGMVGLMVRVPSEDAMLRKQFGEEWEAYAQRVPYRMVPYVF